MPSVPRVRLKGSWSGRAGTCQGRSIAEDGARGAILLREEFGRLRSKGKIVAEALRHGLAGFKRPLKTRGPHRP
jgi:hypothetical protein